MVNAILPFSAAPPALGDFVVGENDEILTAIRALAEGRAVDSSVYIWGDAGAGKSCLLSAGSRYAKSCGLPAYFLHIAPPQNAPVPPPVGGLLAADDIHLADNETQIALFDWLNKAAAGAADGDKKRRQFLLAAGNAAPGNLPLREELATRLAGGLVFRLQVLNDSQKEEALKKHAQRRGFNLPPEVARLLLSRLPRNMHSLNAALEELDNTLLARQKPLTAKRASAWIAERMPQLPLQEKEEKNNE